MTSSPSLSSSYLKTRCLIGYVSFRLYAFNHELLFRLARTCRIIYSIIRWISTSHTNPKISYSFSYKTDFPFKNSLKISIFSYKTDFPFQNSPKVCVYSVIRRISPFAKTVLNILGCFWRCMDDILHVLRPFQQYFSHIILWKGDNERLCAPFTIKKISLTGIEFGTTRSAGHHIIHWATGAPGLEGNILLYCWITQNWFIFCGKFGRVNYPTVL